MAGLTRPEAGRLTWNGAPIAEDPAAHRARLHFIGHQDALKPVLSVAETLAFWAGMRGGANVAAGLQRFRLAALAEWPCRLLSAGQRRRLALARLVAAPAPVWLLDEPAAALDSDGEGRLATLIAAHRAAGGRVVVATHQPIAIEAAETLAIGDYAAAGAD